jgi:hypothetical protein
LRVPVYTNSWPRGCSGARTRRRTPDKP